CIGIHPVVYFEELGNPKGNTLFKSHVTEYPDKKQYYGPVFYQVLEYSPFTRLLVSLKGYLGELKNGNNQKHNNRNNREDYIYGRPGHILRNQGIQKTNKSIASTFLTLTDCQI